MPFALIMYVNMWIPSNEFIFLQKRTFRVSRRERLLPRVTSYFIVINHSLRSWGHVILRADDKKNQKPPGVLPLCSLKYIIFLHSKFELTKTFKILPWWFCFFKYFLIFRPYKDVFRLLFFLLFGVNADDSVDRLEKSRPGSVLARYADDERSWVSTLILDGWVNTSKWWKIKPNSNLAGEAGRLNILLNLGSAD